MIGIAKPPLRGGVENNRSYYNITAVRRKEMKCKQSLRFSENAEMQYLAFVRKNDADF